MPSDSDKPVVLQVLPSLVTGGVERGTIEITQAVAEADGVALVASAGGPLVKAVQRAGGRHIDAAARHARTRSPSGATPPAWRR